MRRIHCDGCGYTEPENLPKHKIQNVSVFIVKDHRFPEGTDKHEADLCPNCIGTMLYQYFNVPAGGKLDLPAFINPKREQYEEDDLEKTEIIGPQSLRWDVEL